MFFATAGERGRRRLGERIPQHIRLPTFSVTNLAALRLVSCRRKLKPVEWRCQRGYNRGLLSLHPAPLRISALKAERPQRSVWTAAEAGKEGPMRINVQIDFRLLAILAVIGLVLLLTK
jgi:hypothetical protein